MTVNLVVSCSARKRSVPTPQLQLRSVRGHEGHTRVTLWNERLDSASVASIVARNLYAGDHWASALRAFDKIRRWDRDTHLWVASAGYGLISADSMIKPYSATFASGHPDSVWDPETDGDRRETLRTWWSALKHEARLTDLLPRETEGALVFVLGAPYLDALACDLREVRSREGADERVSIICAGSDSCEGLIPIDRRFRSIVGGVDASLNARVLEWLAAEPDGHRFRRSSMALAAQRLGKGIGMLERPLRRSATNEQIGAQILDLVLEAPGISRTAALSKIRSRGVACEQRRFASIWETLFGATKSAELTN